MRGALLILIGVLAFAAPARSAIVNVFVDGSYTDARMSLAPQPFSSTSSVVNLELDSDGNGVDGDVTLLSASLHSSYFLSFDALASVSRTARSRWRAAQACSPATRSLDEPERRAGATRPRCSAQARSARSSGSRRHEPPQVSVPEDFFGQPPELGRWVLSEDGSQILGSTRAVFTVGGLAPPFQPGEPVEWLVFGASDLGFVPEPATSALLLLALGALCGVRGR
jgi:hypothetical protein